MWTWMMAGYLIVGLILASIYYWLCDDTDEIFRESTFEWMEIPRIIFCWLPLAIWIGVLIVSYEYKDKKTT